jgi:hypothetical protein
MKNALFILAMVVCSRISAQVTVRASIKPHPTDSSTVFVTLNPSATTTTRVSGISLTLGIPVADAGSTNPPIVINNSPQASISWAAPQYIGTALINGVNNHIYDFQGTGEVNLASSDRTFTAGVDNEIVQVSIGGDGSKRSKVKLVSFPDFGTSGNSLFGLSFLGVDVADFGTPFYSIPTISIANISSTAESFVETTGLRVLPVRFLNFTATKNDNSALLNWLVENEDANTASYEIEISTTGAEFRKVTTLQPLNNGRSSNSYSFTQDNLSGIRNNGIIYFRIKQIDKDGKFVYSDIRNVRISGRGLVLGVYPNPVKQNAKVTFDLESNEKISLILTDASGKQVWGNQLQGVKGVNMTDINMSKFASGTYNLKLQTATESKVLSVVKAD